MDIVLALVVIGLLVVPSIVCWLKGKRLWALLGFFTLWHWIPVFRLAKPSSWWAGKYYGPDKLARATARFPSSRLARDS